jgi:hypothetical protein
MRFSTEFIETYDDTVCYMAHINRIVNIIHVLHGNIIGDIVTDKKMGHVYNICCRMGQTNANILPKLIALDYPTEFISIRYGYRYIPNSNTHPIGFSHPHDEQSGENFLIPEPPIEEDTVSQFEERIFRCCIPIVSSKAMHRTVTMSVIVCKCSVWNGPNEFLTTFDIDTVCYNAENVGILNTASTNVNIYNMMNRIASRKFCLQYIPHKEPKGGMVVFDLSGPGLDSGFGVGVGVRTWKEVNILEHTIQRAINLVGKRGWVMDDIIGGRRSWVVSRWHILKCHPSIVRVKNDISTCFSEEEARHALSLSLYRCISTAQSTLSSDNRHNHTFSNTSYLGYLLPGSEDVCAMCQESFEYNDIVINMACNHNFHACATNKEGSTSGCKGICEWIAKSPTCPCCRCIIR